MKKLILFVFALVTFVQINWAGNNLGSVVLQFDNASLLQKQKIVEFLNAQKNINLEYNCYTSNIFVFKVKDIDFTTKADLEAYIIKLSKESDRSVSVQFIYSDIQLNKQSSDC